MKYVDKSHLDSSRRLLLLKNIYLPTKIVRKTLVEKKTDKMRGG